MHTWQVLGFSRWRQQPAVARSCVASSIMRTTQCIHAVFVYLYTLATRHENHGKINLFQRAVHYICFADTGRLFEPPPCSPLQSQRRRRGRRGRLGGGEAGGGYPQHLPQGLPPACGVARLPAPALFRRPGGRRGPPPPPLQPTAAPLGPPPPRGPSPRRRRLVIRPL